MTDDYLYLDLTIGKSKIRSSIDSSNGESDAGKIVALDATGKLSESFMPSTFDNTETYRRSHDALPIYLDVSWR